MSSLTNLIRPEVSDTRLEGAPQTQVSGKFGFIKETSDFNCINIIDMIKKKKKINR
jgi:hypothetical protein